MRSQTWTRRATAVVVGLVAGLAPSAALAATPQESGPVGTYVVRAVPGHLQLLTRELRAHGTVVRQLPILESDVVRLHAGDVAAVRASRHVLSVTRDRAVTLLGARTAGTATRTLNQVARDLGADQLWAKSITGAGVDVAVVDSGVTPMGALTHVVDGIDLAPSESTGRYVDGFGHGTHMAGIIDGVAPGSRIVNVKVAGQDGASDVSQVIAGIEWVIANAHTDGRNIRVLNLSFGTGSKQDYRIDPLTYAAEKAWLAGIVVVVSAGNNGRTSTGLTDPATDPYVLAVGAVDTTWRRPGIPGFSARGDGTRNPDLVAPGAHVASYLPVGSTIDKQSGDTARTPDGMFRGTGTSQAAAAVSGSAALLLSRFPDLTPDQVKSAFTGTAHTLGSPATMEGAGQIDLAAAAAAATTPSARSQGWARASGTGSLETARAGSHISVNGTEITGETVFTGQAWGGQSWASTTWAGQTWASSTWASSTWASTTWAGQSWASTTWASDSWD